MNSLWMHPLAVHETAQACAFCLQKSRAEAQQPMKTLVQGYASHQVSLCTKRMQPTQHR